MGTSKPSAADAASKLIEPFALELAFVEPGKDTSLLPINTLIIQAEELIEPEATPREVSTAVKNASVQKLAHGLLRLGEDEQDDNRATPRLPSRLEIGAHRRMLKSGADF